MSKGLRWFEWTVSLIFVSCSYRVTLNQNEKTDDPEGRARALKACHQRCANRTLKVLEKNGSVFIKLGQHLVWWDSLFGPEVR